jgi:hypothetical protein
MKLGSKECVDALNNYQSKSYMETIAVKVLLAKDEDVINVVWDLNDTQMDEIQYVITDVRNNIGIVE